MKKPSESNPWIQSLVITAVVFVLFSVYLYLRRGYFNLYIANKVFGSSAAVLAGYTLAIGPLSEKYAELKRYAGGRKELGLIAFYLALAHIGASLMQQSRFSFPSWYLDEWIPVVFGLIAIGVWYYMKHISNKEAIQKAGFDIWRKRLSLYGKIAFLAVFLHLVIMKYTGWSRWFQGLTKQSPELLNPSYPPASLFVLLAITGVIIYRIIHDYGPQKKH